MTKLYQTAKPPWEHQQRCLNRLERRPFFALLMAMRTGKTKVTIDDFGWLEIGGDVDDMLVFAPAGVYHTWAVAFGEHASADLKARSWVHVWEAKQKSGRDKLTMKRFLDYRDGPRVLIVDIEALSSVDRVFEICSAFLSQRRVYFVVDESTTIKNDSIRTIRCLKLRDINIARSGIRRILTGLVNPRSPLDVFFQFEFLQPGCLGHVTFATFKARYAEEVKVCTLPTGVLVSKLKNATGTGRLWRDGVQYDIEDLPRPIILQELDRRKIWYDSFPKINNYKNEEELRDIIAEMSYRVRLEDCYDLPPKMYTLREVALTPDQRRIYQEIKEQATAELIEIEKTSHVVALNVISRMTRLHQVLCGHVRDEHNELHEIKENRTGELLKLLSEYEGKAVIWCSYDYNVQKITAALEKEFGEGSVSRFWGGNIKTREAEELVFQNDEKCRFMIATQSAGGRGRYWAVANLAVYFSNQNNLEHRSQSEERTQAVNKAVSVGYTDLYVPGTVDERIIFALRDKIDMASTIMGDNWRSWLV
jgi:hypothetical protein